MSFTVIGSTGFIGSKLIQQLKATKLKVFCPSRGDKSVFIRPLGHAIYCAGLTADFRTRPFDTVRAHVSYLLEILCRAKFDSFLYLSSARVYGGAKNGKEEATFQLDPRNPSDLYNLSKLQGEALCYATGRDTVRVVRLSNVYGEDWTSENFLTSLIHSAVDKKKITLTTALNSAKDYVSIEDVMALLPSIALRGKRRLYNIASGKNIRNQEIVSRIQKATGCDVLVKKAAPRIVFPTLDTRHIRSEFKFKPRSLLDSIDPLIESYQANLLRDRHKS